jgi:hypothetical protein
MLLSQLKKLERLPQDTKMDVLLNLKF